MQDHSKTTLIRDNDLTLFVTDFPPLYSLSSLSTAFLPSFFAFFSFFSFFLRLRSAFSSAVSPSWRLRFLPLSSSPLVIIEASASTAGIGGAAATSALDV